jgi:hypothetical protein
MEDPFTGKALLSNSRVLSDHRLFTACMQLNDRLAKLRPALLKYGIV